MQVIFFIIILLVSVIPGNIACYVVHGYILIIYMGILIIIYNISTTTTTATATLFYLCFEKFTKTLE